MAGSMYTNGTQILLIKRILTDNQKKELLLSSSFFVDYFLVLNQVRLEISESSVFKRFGNYRPVPKCVKLSRFIGCKVITGMLLMSTIR